MLSKQLYISFKNILSKFHCGFRKGFSSQHFLLLMIEKWKEVADKDQSFGALLKDLSKSFHCFNHELLTAKLYSYGIFLRS